MMEVDLKYTHGKAFDLFMFTDSLQQFDALSKGKRTEERRLMIDIFAVRQSYNRYEITALVTFETLTTTRTG